MENKETEIRVFAPARGRECNLNKQNKVEEQGNAVKLIRCKDCKHAMLSLFLNNACSEGYCYCDKFRVKLPEDNFCSFGVEAVVRENEQER